MARKYRALGIFWCVFSFVTILITISTAQAQENGISSGHQPGKLYVLDAGNNHKKARVLVVDQSNGKVIRTYDAGDQPDMALSPDGTQLFVAYFFENAAARRESVLDIYATASGTLIDHVGNPEALQHKVSVYESSMVMAPSGKQIYIEKYHWTPGAPGPSGCYVSIFDTAQRHFEGMNISVSNCGHVVLPANEGLKFYMVSANTHSIDEFTPVLLNESGTSTHMSHRYIPIKFPESVDSSSEVKKSNAAPAPCEVGPRASTRTLGPVFLLQEDGMIGAFLDDGSRLAVDLSAAVTKFMGKEPSSGKGWGMQSGLRRENSPVYLSAAQETNSYFERYDQIVRIDPATMAITGTMTTSVPFFGMSMSPDQSTLFTVNPERATITAIDALSLKEISQFSVGVKPIFAIAAP
jgi:DNA-binding beta-propeller fold protein YncE